LFKLKDLTSVSPSRTKLTNFDFSCQIELEAPKRFLKESRNLKEGEVVFQISQENGLTILAMPNRIGYPISSGER
jgi:hypothetical protein